MTLRSQLAERSSTLLDRHPRIKELKAQVYALDRRCAAKRKGSSIPSRTTPHRRRARRDDQCDDRPGEEAGSASAGRRCNCARSSAKPRRSAIFWNPISANIARRARETPRCDAVRRAGDFARDRLERAGLPEEDPDPPDRDARDHVPRDVADRDRRSAARRRTTTRGSRRPSRPERRADCRSSTCASARQSRPKPRQNRHGGEAGAEARRMPRRSGRRSGAHAAPVGDAGRRITVVGVARNVGRPIPRSACRARWCRTARGLSSSILRWKAPIWRFFDRSGRAGSPISCAAAPRSVRS